MHIAVGLIVFSVINFQLLIATCILPLAFCLRSAVDRPWSILRIRYSIYILLFLFNFSPSLFSQTPTLRHFSDDDGLPSMTVYGIKQDPNGYLWMTTTKGICRFDGQEFKKYEVPDLKGQDIPFLFMDDQGAPWFYNLAGEIAFIRNDTIFNTSIKSPDHQMMISSFYVFHNQLYITWKFNLHNETLVYDIHDFRNVKKLKRPYGIIGELNGKLIGNDLDNRAYYFQLYSIIDDSLLLNYPLHSNDNFNYHSEINIVSKLSNDSIVIITPYFSGLLNSKFQLIQSLKFREILRDTMHYVSLINAEDIYIKTNLSSYIWNLRTNGYQKDTVHGTSINTIFEDSFKRKWISTTNKGLFLSMNPNCLLYTNSNSGLYSSEIIHLFKDEPFLFIGHNNGAISIYNEQSRIWHKLIIEGSRRIKSIIKIKNNEYMAGTDKGLFAIHIKDDFTYSTELMKFASIKDLSIIEGNGLMILTNTGTYSCNKENLKDKEYKLIVEHASINMRSTSVVKYKDTMLIGTVNGIYYKNGNEFIKWNTGINSEIYINKLYNQADSILWICTDGNGVYMYQNGIICDSVNISNGLLSNSISCIAGIDADRVVVGTDNGAFVYDKKNHIGFGFNQLDGLPAKEVTDLCCLDGLVWFGTPKGLATIPIKDLKPNQESPFISIASITVYSKGGQNEFKQELPYYSNHLRIKLQTRSLISKDQLKILYTFNNRDSNWIPVNNKMIELVGLAPGSYTLYIKASNEDGIATNVPIQLSFQINAPWWKTFWFNASMIGCLIAASIGITYWRQNKKRKEELRKQNIIDQMNQLRQQALQNQMNPHFIFNALNAIQSFLIVNDEMKAVNYLSKFGKLIRLIFEQSKLKTISLQDEIDLLKNYLHLEELRFGNKVKVNFTIEPELEENAADISIPPLLIQPIIENAFRHGLFHLEKNGLLYIRIYRRDNNIVCSIEDNGVGRAESRRINKWKNSLHKSSGIKSTLERLAILDQGRNQLGLEITDLFDESGNPRGTKAILTL